MASEEGQPDYFDVFNQEKESEVKVKKEKIDESNENDVQISSSDLIESITGKKRKSTVEEDRPKKVKRDSLLDKINVEELKHRVKVYPVECSTGCTHEVCVPPDETYTPLRRGTGAPAKSYPFVLDPFQKEAIVCLENNQSVMVSAHTSAGKTVVAEYAIALALKDKRRVIYTTPIKALSNQKFREFSEEFQDVGLMTGDVTINPTATCLIMTTEILRSMLYRGSEVLREVGWVVFDEIHYMRDKERGYVWEESLILSSESVRYVFLSATIPNARQFAEWIAFMKKQPCHVVYTDFRPVPLQHYVYPSGGEGLYLCVDENGTFKEENFGTAMAVLQTAGEAAKGDSAIKGRKGGFKEESAVLKITRMIMDKNFSPVIIFSFSKKDCEAYALQVAKLDFNSSDEKILVEEVFRNAMDSLSEEDRKLPQVEAVLPLLKKGIGIHHGGLLPILKETIEILFGEGLIKALFATETFAMGLNMPARTVLFSTARKFDGQGYRWVTSGEYIQMSGRAGRRGIDDKGIVILVVDERMAPSSGKEIIKGEADALNSSYHLTYNMVLNLLRVEDINPEFMLEKSFFQFQNFAAIPKLHQQLLDLTQEMENLVIERESEVTTYHNIRRHLDVLAKEYQSWITLPKYLIPFLQPGRLVTIKHNDLDFGWGMVVGFKEESPKGSSKKDEEEEIRYIVHVLVNVAKSTTPEAKESTSFVPPLDGDTGTMVVLPFMMNLIQKVSSIRIYVPTNLKSENDRMSVLKNIKEVKKRFPDGLQLLDPTEDMQITEKPFEDIVRRIRMFEDRMKEHPLHNNPKLDALYTAYERKLKVSKDLTETKGELKKAKSLLQMDDLKCRKRVLRRMGYCTNQDVIELKGRVACELDSGDELLLTEMIFNNVFKSLDVHQSVSLLSCLVCDEKQNEDSVISETLSGPLRQMQNLARRIAKIASECKLDVKEEEYVDKFKPTLMEVVHAWSKGASFADVCKMTDTYEGSIIRCMRRLEELLRQLVQAAQGIGNTELEIKFNEGIKNLKRDIVFAGSLYL